MLSGSDGQHLLRRISLSGVRESFLEEPQNFRVLNSLGSYIKV
jgi:hypothetical protein